MNEWMLLFDIKIVIKEEEKEERDAVGVAL